MVTSCLWVYGTVTQVGTGVPLVGARVSVFGTTIKTGANGCFESSLADALPFEFSVEDVGYKTVVSKPPRGFFRSTVALAQDGTDRLNPPSEADIRHIAFDAQKQSPGHHLRTRGIRRSKTSTDRCRPNI